MRPGPWVDSVLARLSARSAGREGPALPTRRIDTPAGPVRVFDTGTAGPCVVFVPDGPNVIEHYEPLIALLAARLRVVCFDMPGFGHSRPQPSYAHSLDQGAGAVLGVLDALGDRGFQRLRALPRYRASRTLCCPADGQDGRAGLTQNP